MVAAVLEGIIRVSFCLFIYFSIIIRKWTSTLHAGKYIFYNLMSLSNRKNHDPSGKRLRFSNVFTLRSFKISMHFSYTMSNKGNIFNITPTLHNSIYNRKTPHQYIFVVVVVGITVSNFSDHLRTRVILQTTFGPLSFAGLDGTGRMEIYRGFHITQNVYKVSLWPKFSVEYYKMWATLLLLWNTIH